MSTNDPTRGMSADDKLLFALEPALQVIEETRDKADAALAGRKALADLKLRQLVGIADALKTGRASMHPALVGMFAKGSPEIDRA